MKPFTAEGEFWLPSMPDRKVAGTLAFADGLMLTLSDSLQAFQWPTEGQVHLGGQQMRHPIVHGELRDGRHVTLLEVFGVDLSGPFGRITEVHDMAAGLVGGLLDEDRLDLASCRFDVLPAWVGPDPMYDDRDRVSDEVGISMRRNVLATAEHGRLTVMIFTDVEGEVRGDRVSLDQVCGIEIQGPAAPLRTVVADWVRPLQDFLIIALGRPVRLTSLHVRASGAGARDGHPEAFFGAVQPAEGPVLSAARVRSYDSPALHRREDTTPPLDELLSAWLALRQEVHDVSNLLTGPFYAPFIYGEHKYAATFQSAEALAKRRHGGKEKSRVEHRQRVATVAEALATGGLPEDTIGWATRILQGRNDRSLPQLIEALVQSAGDVGAELLATAPNFARTASDLRVGVSHGGVDTADPLVRYWHGQALLWVVRTRLLNEIGVPLEVLAARARATPAFKRMLLEVSGTSRHDERRSSQSLS